VRHLEQIASVDFDRRRKKRIWIELLGA